jgi:hypothetical protein
MLMLAAALALQDPSVTIRILDGSTRRPVFGRVVLKGSAGQTVGSTGYRTLDGHFVPPEGWTVSLPKGVYALHADAGFEFFAHDESWTVDGAGTKDVALKRWVDLRKDGWYAGGDHNHLNRDGAGDKNYGKTQVTLEFAAALHASRGWSWFSAGGGGPWVVEGGGGDLHGGRRTEAAAAAWNAKHGAHLRLGWNNEAIKGRYGHVWVLGDDMAGLTFPYTAKPGDAWWAFYDDSWDPWQTGDRSRPLGPFKSSQWDNPPVFDCIRSWREAGILSIYAHPTRTFMIGKNRVSNIAVEFPFDLLAGAPVGGLAIMGDVPDHAGDQALWFAALNEGFRVPGLAENDTVFGSPDIRRGPHATYVQVPDMGATIDMKKIVDAIGAGRVFASSGAFCRAQVLGGGGKGYPMGSTYVAEPGIGATLHVLAAASSDPADLIERVEVIADGKVIHAFEAAAGRREYQGGCALPSPLKWVIVKTICRDRSAVAITSPIYFGPPPEPLTASVSGKTAPGADIVIRAWSKEVSRAKAGPDGRYRLEAPLAAHLEFAHKGHKIERVLLWDDPGYRDLHFKMFSTWFVGRPGTLGDGLPADIFKRIRDRAKEVVVDAEFPD